MKYKINRQLFPFSLFTPPISERFLALAVPFMREPKFIYKDRLVDTRRLEIESFDGDRIECLLMSPKDLCESSPCLIYLHGGGFVLPAADYHYKNSLRYATECGCRVLFVNYRLAPKHPHPTFFEDCYAAACWLYDNAEKYSVDRQRIGIGGDSAGGTLSVGVCMMLRDRNHPLRPLFQMLPYPFLDARNSSESCKRCTDTPMWNSTLSGRIARMTRVDRSSPDYFYYSPIEADSLDGLPPAYIETAEFDCLHDDGILYAERLREEGISVTLNETRGTMHGFDIVQRAEITKLALRNRIDFMQTLFAKRS